MPVDLGFVADLAPQETSPLKDEIFPSKLGGRPVWLNPEQIPEAEALMCPKCTKPMSLLLQIYTPDDDREQAFHRTVYIFLCRYGTCHSTGLGGSLKVYRSQLPKENNYYIYDEKSDKYRRAADASSAPLCRVCGLKGSKVCGGCKVARYCSREHQAADWNRGGHRKDCATTKASLSFVDIEGEFFPEREIISEPEEPDSDPEEGEEDDEVEKDAEVEKVREKIKEYRIDTDNGEYDPEDYEKQDTDVDRAFLKFQKVVERFPDQVLRYARVESDVADPLFVNENGKPAETDISCCALCGEKRKFEFQIMPQLLNYLPIDHKQVESLDWGTLLVYSCPNHCVVDGRGLPFVEEMVWRQDFSADGMGKKLRDAVLKPEDDAVVEP